MNINSNSFHDINKDINPSINKKNNINNIFNNNFPEKEKNYNFEINNNIQINLNPENKRQKYNKEKNEDGNPFYPIKKIESIQKENTQDKQNEYNKNDKEKDFIELNSEKDFNPSQKDFQENNTERKSESDSIHKSIYYERCDSDLFNGESKYIQKNKKIKRKKNIKKSKPKKKYNDEQSLEIIQKENPNYQEERNENIGNIIFNNKYINKGDFQNEVTDIYNKDIDELKNKKILYQDFFYREISFSEGSSIRSSVNSDSIFSENLSHSRLSHPLDSKRDKIKRNNVNQIIEPSDEFSKYIFEQINNIRLNPKSFVNKIEESKKNIGLDKRNNNIYNGNQKVLLNNGIYAFDNAIKHLNVLRNMEKLNYNPKMNIKLPSNEEEINDRKYQNKMVDNLVKDKIKIKSFWREIIKDPEECFLLMIVDDSGNNCGFKRKDVLDPRITNIGINSIKMGKYFACYIQLS